jgi:O-antigen ligase
MNSPYVFGQKLYDSYENVIGEFSRLQSVGFLQNPNDFAQYLLVAASLLMFTWKPGRRLRNVLLVWLPMAYLMWGVWATHSRGGLIGLSVVVFFLLEKRIGRISSLLVAGTLLRLLFLANGAGPRLTSLHDPSVAGRIDAWEGGIQMLTTSPLFGVGFKLFQSKYPALTAHNSFVLCFAELGILGYLFWLGLIVFSVTDLNRILRNENTPGCTPDAVRCAGAIRTALFSFLITAWFLSRTYTMTFYLLLGMAVAMRQLLLHRKTEPLIDLPRWALTFTCAAVSIVAVCATIWLKSL